VTVVTPDRFAVEANQNPAQFRAVIGEFDLQNSAKLGVGHQCGQIRQREPQFPLE